MPALRSSSGATGRSSDAAVFSRSAMKSFIEDHGDDLPDHQELPNIGKVPCHILVDQGFRQTLRFACPYSHVETAADIECAHFNVVHSRARRIVENYFGILANRFRILLRPICGSPEVAKKITLTVMILHNKLVARVGAESAAQRFGFSSAFGEAEHLGVAGNLPHNSKVARDMLKEYFAARDGLRKSRVPLRVINC